MMITSRSNPLIVETAALKEKKYRDRDRLFMLEGEKLLQEALVSKAELTHVFCTPDKLELCRTLGVSDELIALVSEEVLKKLSTEKAPQGVICVSKYIDKFHNINKIYSKEDFPCGAVKRCILLSSLRDPGNLGTIIRTALAFGIDEILMSSDCADLYNPRTVRASMGAVLKQRISVCDSLANAITTMRECGYSVYAAMLDRSAKTLTDIEISDKTAFVIGNEGHGISEEIASCANGKVYIPMEAGAESLNAAVAASVFMWQMYR